MLERTAGYSDIHLRRQTRLLILLDSAERAGMVPIAILPLHALAYLSNVLAPVWKLDMLDAKILKRRGGPFYPGLQGELDRLVGRGVVKISGVSHVCDEDGRWRLQGRFALNRELAGAALDRIASASWFAQESEFVRELALAFAWLSEPELASALTEDATYSDPMQSDRNVIDFGEWGAENQSAAAATLFRDVGRGVSLTPGEQIHLYVKHLYRRAHAS